MNLEKSTGKHRRKMRSRKRRKSKLLITIPVVLILLIAGTLFGGSYYIINQLADHRVVKLETTPAKLGLPSDTINITSSDGIPLKAWLIPNASPKGIVILLHGMDGMDSSSMLGHSKFLYDAGYTSIALDMRAHGRSGGDRIGFAFDEPKDVISLLDWIKGKEEYKGLPVAVLGVSMGGATAIRAAAAREDINAVISVSSYASIEKMSADFMRGSGVPGIFVDITLPFMKLVYTIKYWVIPSNSSPSYDMAKISPRPILIAHGTADTQTIVDHANMLYEASGKKAELWIENGADHCIFKGNAAGSEDKFYSDKIIEFLDRSLKK